MRNVRGPPGVTEGGTGVAGVVTGVVVLVGAVTGSGVDSSEEILAQPFNNNRKIARVRNRRIIQCPKKVFLIGGFSSGIQVLYQS